LLSDRVSKLMTKSVSMVEVVFDLIGFKCIVLFCIARVCLVADVAVDLKVEMELVKSKLSWILAIVTTGVEAPDMSSSTLVSGKMRSVL